MVSTGDTGSAGCDDLSETVAQHPVSVNLLASTPFSVAVGGTMFNENRQDSKYWSSALPLAETPLSYIPENVWNESCTIAQCGSRNANIAAVGGGGSIVFSKTYLMIWGSTVPPGRALGVPGFASMNPLPHPYPALPRASRPRGARCVGFG